MTGPWTLEVFEADDGTIPWQRFVNELSVIKFAALKAAMSRVLAVEGTNLVRTEWLKPLGGGLHEFRVRHSADEIARIFGGATPGPAGAGGERVLLRIFVHFHGSKVILLLGGYDKGADSKERRQQREIAQARRLLTQFKERQRRQRPRPGPTRPRPR